MFIPCVNGRCPGRMQLRVMDSRNRPISRPFYLCDQDGREKAKWHCRNADEPIYPENLRISYVRDGTTAKQKGYKHSDHLTMEEVGSMI